MAAQELFDGFISKRDSSDAFAHALHSHLYSQNKVKAAYQAHLSGEDDEDHRRAAAQIIERTHFTIIMIGPDGLDSFTEREKCFQQEEIEKAFLRRKKRERSAKPYGIFIIQLINDPTPQTCDDFNEMIGMIRHGSRTFPNVYDAPESNRRDDPRWQATLDKVGNDVRYFLGKSKITPVLEQDPWTQPVNQGVDPVVLTPEERTYIDRNMTNWLKGQPDAVDQSEGDTDEDLTRRALFEFDPRRCILLNASAIDNDDDDFDKTAIEDDGEHIDEQESGDQHFRIMPALSSIFEDLNSPLLIIGEAGAGKTTSLTTAAAFMASMTSRDFRPRANEIMNTEMGEIARNFPKRTPIYIPIVIRCTVLAAKMKTARQLAFDDFKTLLHVLHEALFPDQKIFENDSEKEGAQGAIRARMVQQPYAIYLDALDEVLDDGIAERILKLAKYAYEDFIEQSLKIKIVISSRPSSFISHDAHCVELMALRMDQVSTYFESFAKSLSAPTADQKRDFVRRAEASFKERDSLAEFLSLPFNLNCFCWLSWQDWLTNRTKEAPTTETEFFKMIINHLIDGMNLLDMDGNPLPMGMLRLVLRRLANEALNSDGGKDRLQVEDAVKLCEHSLSSGYAYLSDKEYPEIKHGYAQQLLENIVNRSGLLRRQGDYYRFRRVRFCEYLAGERIDSDALTSASIQNLRIAKLDDVLESLKFCYALRIKRNVAPYADNVLKGLIDRADEASRGGKNDEAFDWLNASLECIGSAMESDLSGQPRYGPESEGYELVCSKAVEMLSHFGTKLMPARRAETTSMLMFLGHRSNSAVTVTKVRGLFERLTANRQRWLPAEVPESKEPGAATRKILVERTPVLVCEFEDFLARQGRANGLWDHADEAQRVCIDKAPAIGQDDLAPMEVWRKQRRSPGNPVTWVTWYEAVAYANWMTSVTENKAPEEQCRLPAEHELLAISTQLANGEAYPWGKQLSKGIDSEANWRGAEVNNVSPPGTFGSLEMSGPSGPVGELVDFGSNVRVWTIDTDADGRPKWPLDEPVPLEEMQFVAGGSWADRSLQLRAERRGKRSVPNKRSRRVGIRLVRDKLSN